MGFLDGDSPKYRKIIATKSQTFYTSVSTYRVSYSRSRQALVRSTGCHVFKVSHLPPIAAEMRPEYLWKQDSSFHRKCGNGCRPA